MIEVGQQALSTSFISKLFINVQLFSSIIQSKLLRPRKIFFHFCVGFLVKFKGKWPQLQNYSGTRCWFLEIWIMPTDVCEKCDSDRRWSVGGARVIENWRKLPLSYRFLLSHSGIRSFSFCSFFLLFFFSRETHTKQDRKRAFEPIFGWSDRGLMVKSYEKRRIS